MTSRTNLRRLHRSGPPSASQALRMSGRLIGTDRGAAGVPAVGIEAIAERLVSHLSARAGKIRWMRRSSEQNQILERIAPAVDLSTVQVLQHGSDPAVAFAAVEVRMAAVDPGQDFLLVGEDAAFLFDRDAEGYQVLSPVSQVAVIRAFGTIFDQLWAVARPVLAEIEDELGGEARRIIIQMLGDGATDDAIARTLGISRRTIARHVAQIMHCTGTLSRFQTGMRLAQLGLLVDPRCEQSYRGRSRENSPFVG